MTTLIIFFFKTVNIVSQLAGGLKIQTFKPNINIAAAITSVTSSFPTSGEAGMNARMSL